MALTHACHLIFVTTISYIRKHVVCQVMAAEFIRIVIVKLSMIGWEK